MDRYLTVTANYTGSCIQDDYVGEINLKNLNLKFEFLNELSLWNEEYKKIIPLSDQERLSLIKKIDKLDEWGINISKKLMDLFPNSKIRYYSEGKLKYLNL